MAHESLKDTLSFGKRLERTHFTTLGDGAKHAVCSHHSRNNSSKQVAVNSGGR